MKIVERILIYFILIARAMENSTTLYNLSIRALKEACGGEDGVSIINRIYPNFFDVKTPKGYSTLLNSIDLLEFPSEEIDLSCLNLKTIPDNIAKKLKHVKKLNLSDNPLLNMNEKWVENFYDNLEELEFENCDFKEDNLKAIAKLKSLKRLSLSNISIVDRLKPFEGIFKTKILEPILKNLTCLNFSYNKLSSEDLEFILAHADNLEYLDLSGNDLSKQTDLVKILQENNTLKVLELRHCKLTVELVQNIIQFSNLEEIDFSASDLTSTEGQENILRKSLVAISKFIGLLNSDKFEYVTKSDKQFLKSKLKKINLRLCFCKNKKLMEILFNIEGLEVLDLACNYLDFDMSEIFQGGAKHTLKDLNVYYCGINSAETLKLITDFENLKKLNISGLKFINMPDDFSFGQSKSSLEELIICDSKLSDIAFKCIAECTCLKKLNLSRSDFSNITTSALNLNAEKLTETLKEIEVVHSKDINYTCFRFLTDFPNLEKIDFSLADFSSFTGENSLGCSKESLKEIYLIKANINYEILFDITDCPNLKILNVSENNFQGIPHDFQFGRSKESLKELYISEAYLNYSGLNAISECTNLEILNIGYRKYLNVNDIRVKDIIEKLKRTVRYSF